MFTEMRARIRRRRRIKAAKAVNTPLREFVYLDETSVYSLLASREGALPAEYTHTRTDSTTDELESRIKADAAILKADLSAKTGTARAESVQILRKYTVQAAFKEFHEGEEDRLAITPISSGSTLPAVNSWEELRQALGSPRLDGWVIYPESLDRGQLVELEIELRAEPIFEFTSIVTTMQGIIHEAPELLQGSEYPHQQIAAANRVLGQLLVGLIPLRCLAIDYKVVSLEDQTILVHRRLIDHLPKDETCVPKPLWIVGVTEERFFWKDVRQVLFSGSRFRMLCRINNKGLQHTWVPVKLVNLLRRIAPGLADQIRDLSQNAFSAGQSQMLPTDSYERRMRDALIGFGVSLAARYAGRIEADELAPVAAQAIASERGVGESNGNENRREIFKVITEYVSQHVNIDPDPVIVAQLRWMALQDAGLGISGSSGNSYTTSRAPHPSAENDSMLDTEIVAIYW